MPSVNTVIFATRKKTTVAARARLPYGGSPLGRETNRARMYTRMRSVKEIEIREMAPSARFTLTGFERFHPVAVVPFRRPNAKDTINRRARGNGRGKKGKEGIRSEEPIVRHAIRYLKRSVGRSEVLLCTRHRAGIIIYMAAPDNLHKSAVMLRKIVGAIKRMFARGLRTCHRAV